MAARQGSKRERVKAHRPLKFLLKASTQNLSILLPSISQSSHEGSPGNRPHLLEEAVKFYHI